MEKGIPGEWSKSEFTSLDDEENLVMGAYLALPAELREERVLEVTRIAKDEIKRIRRTRTQDGE